MYCKKCKYHAHDHISTCPKCGTNWEETRKDLHLAWMTKPGYNWLSLSAPRVSEEHILATGIATGGESTVRDDIDFPETITPPVMPKASANQDLDVSLLPELDLNLMDETPVPAPTPAAPEPVFTMPELEVPELDFGQDLDLSTPTEIKPEKTSPTPTMEEFSLPEDVLELDFSSAADVVPVQTPSRSPKKKEDLFIPELEEMLAPLTEDQKPSAPAKKLSFSEDDDILLDFNMDDHK